MDNATQDSRQEKFDWDSDPSVILHDQAATAARINSSGELVIWQRDTVGNEATVFVAAENIDHFLAGLGRRAKPAPQKLHAVDGGKS